MRSVRNGFSPSIERNTKKSTIQEAHPVLDVRSDLQICIFLKRKRHAPFICDKSVAPALNSHVDLVPQVMRRGNSATEKHGPELWLVNLVILRSSRDFFFGLYFYTLGPDFRFTG